MLKKMTKESEAELSEKEDHTFEQLYNLSMEQNEKWLLSLNSYVLKINL